MSGNEPYDSIVVGGGPGGSSTAAYLGLAGRRVLLLDRATFPRPKTCGDAISGKAVRIIRELGLQQLVEQADHDAIEGVRFASPDGSFVDIPFPAIEETGSGESGGTISAGYVMRRELFDAVLFQGACSQPSVEACQGFEVTDVLFDGRRAVGIRGTDAAGTHQEIPGRTIVGADGAMSIVAREVGSFDHDRSHWVGSYRSYFEGVSEMTGYLEIYFLEAVLPGYFWIFSLGNGLANVGIGVLESEVRQSKRRGGKLNMRECMYRVIAEHPLFRSRFAGAREITESRKGWLLPLGSKHRKIHGDGWLLVGDAAALIDPFSGEGIGNALVSAQLASRTIIGALAAGDVSERALAPYETEVRAELDRELRMSHKLQRLIRWRWLVNIVIRRATQREHIRSLISSMLVDYKKKEAFGTAGFYLSLLR